MQPFAEKFYKGGAWKRCRAAFIKWRISVDGGMCQVCRDRLGEMVHHIVWLTEENINDPDISLNFDNLQYVCYKCHGRIKDPKKRKSRYYFDGNGNMVVPPFEE